MKKQHIYLNIYRDIVAIIVIRYISIIYNHDIVESLVCAKLDMFEDLNTFNYLKLWIIIDYLLKNYRKYLYSIYKNSFKNISCKS